MTKYHAIISYDYGNIAFPSHAFIEVEDEANAREEIIAYADAYPKPWVYIVYGKFGSDEVVEIRDRLKSAE